jgi:peptidoglycan-N-acetylglucosamine deacetylase
MTRRMGAVAASALAVLVLVVGVAWAVNRFTAAPVAQGVEWRTPPPRPSTPAAPVTPSADDPASTQPAGPTATAPEPTASSTPAPQPSASEAQPTSKPSKTASGGLDLRRTTGSTKVALTFDDGPHPVWTPKILDELRAANVRATFCLVGTQAKRYPELVARIVREGHTLCNHSWNHEFNLGKLSEDQIRDNLERTNQAIRQAVPDAKIKFFRHPGGNWTPAAVKVAKELGMVSLHWTVDPRDWERPGAAVIEQRVVENAKPGAIVLLHDGGGDRSATLAACPAIIQSLKQRYGIVLLT